MDTQSAEGFLKSLKASNDVELAISAYANEKLYIPSKGQVLATWAFNTLLKNNSTVSDSRYWTLLESIMLGDSTSSPPWLPTLVYKTPVVPILTSILRNFAIENGKGLSREMLEPCHRVLKVVLPIAYPKTRLDTVLDCFWASLDALSGTLPTLPIDSIRELVNLGVDGFRAAFTKATNKTKIYGSFIEGHFTSFARAILNTHGHFNTKELIWAAARDIVCSFDATRAISQQIEVSNQGFFGTLLQTCESMPEVLRLCPRLFVDQIAAARAHRSALSQINVEIHPWQHYTSFAFVFKKMDTAEGALAWLEMLTEVEKHVGSGIREQRWVDILSSTARQCLQKLRPQETKNGAELQSSLIGSLVILGRMNYDLLASHIPQILEILAHLPSTISGCELYEVILSYHSKTRNMDNFSKELFGVVLDLPAKGESLPSTIDKGAVFDVMNSCLLGTTTGSVLSLALKQYVTPGQITRIVSMAVLCLQETWRPLKDIFDIHPPSIISAQSNICASRLALVFRLASFVLPALPVASTLQRELTDWRNTLREEVVMPSLKLVLDERNVKNWAFQIVGSAILRFISSLEGTPLSFKGSQTLDLAGATSIDNPLLHRMELLGDLKLELTRVLLCTSSPDNISVVIQNTLGYLSLTKGEAWNGRATAMTTGALSTGLTLLLTDRWLTTLESYATNDQLEQFVRLIILSYNNDHLHAGGTSILPSVLIQRMLRNGLFWELSRLQAALLSAIVDGTERAELVESGLPPGQMQPPEPSPWSTVIGELGRYFHILLYFPFEALKGGNAATLARRAILIDRAASQSSDPLSFSTLATRTSCRLFASRCLQDAKSSFADYIGNKRTIQFLTVAEPGFQSHPELDASFFQATYAILDFAFSVFIRRTVQSESNIEELLLLFSPLITAPLNNAEPSYLNGLAHLLYSLAVWWNTSDHLQNQEQFILAFLTPLQDTLQDFLSNSLLEQCSLLPSLLRLLRACLRFRHMHPFSIDETIGSYILASLSILQSPQKTSKVRDDSLTELMSILVDALELAPDDSDLAARMISLHYLASSRHNVTLDLSLQRGVKLLKTQAYEHSLRIGMEMLGTESSKSLVHALTILLVHCPEGTFKIAQSTFCESLAMLNDILSTARHNIDFGLQREFLHYVLCICTEKPAFLRFPDVGGILTLLASLLQPSVQNVQCTHAHVFHTIVKTTTALVRNRRDLILLSLPHLAVVFCLLFGTLAKSQPNLGQKQFRSISNRLPHWIALSQPLGSPEATSLSRLLVTMTTKTIVRSTRMGHASHEGGKDAQSLAKPFGKHASCVIGAYIDLLNDPLCLLDRETRMELTPGLFSLCGMIGEKGRDALMPTLDAGGKVIFKHLWSSYEKQKYVGKG